MLERYFEIMQISYFQLLSLLFSHSVVSNHLQPHKWQRARLPCPSLFPGVCSNLCSLSQWCHPTISSSVIPFSSCLNFSQHHSLLQCVGSLHQVAKYWSFSSSISSSNEYSELISIRVDWFDLLAVQGTLKSLPQHCSSKASILQRLTFFYFPDLISIHDY